MPDVHSERATFPGSADGHSRRSSSIVDGACLISALAAGLLLWSGLGPLSGALPEPLNSPARRIATTAAVADPSAAKRITNGEYGALREGLSRAEAIAVVGEAPVEVGRSRVGGAESVQYLWRNGDGSWASIVVANEKLVLKSQFGL